jgi:hypothetical protein
VLDRNIALMCSHPEQDFPYFGEVTPLLEEALLIPFHIKGEAGGTIWIVSHDEHRRFDREDLRVMTNLGSFAASAYQMLLYLEAAQKKEFQAMAGIQICKRQAAFSRLSIPSRLIEGNGA